MVPAKKSRAMREICRLKKTRSTRSSMSKRPTVIRRSRDFWQRSRGCCDRADIFSMRTSGSMTVWPNGKRRSPRNPGLARFSFSQPSTNHPQPVAVAFVGMIISRKNELALLDNGLKLHTHYESAANSTSLLRLNKNVKRHHTHHEPQGHVWIKKHSAEPLDGPAAFSAA